MNSSIPEKIASLKKAGIPTMWIVLMGIMSTPGWTEFFDRTEDDALKAIKNAYPVLAKEVDHLGDKLNDQRRVNELLLQEIRSLNTRIDALMIRDVDSRIGMSGRRRQGVDVIADSINRPTANMESDEELGMLLNKPVEDSRKLPEFDSLIQR